MTLKTLMMPAAAAAFDPTTLPNLALWLDASDAASITSSSGLVSQWDDKSGNGRHVTASSTARPTTGAHTQNSRNVLEFNGSSNVMVSTGSIQDPTLTLYVACRCKASATNSGQSPLFIGQRTSSALTLGFYLNGTAPELRVYDGGSEVTVAATRSTNDVVLWGGTTGSTGVNRALFNGTAKNGSGSLGNSTPGASDRVVVGSLSRTSSPFFWQGYIFEAAIYTDVHSTAQIDSFLSYFSTKWGTT